MRKFLFSVLVCLSFHLCLQAEEKQITLASENSVVDILVDGNDNQTVRLSTGLFSEDIERLTGKKPVIKNSAASLSRFCVIIGSIGESEVINDLVKRKKINISEIKGKWEAAVTEIVDHPYEGVEKALVIAGSDRRGTAFAVLDISKRIGVSPWYYFADVTPTHKDRIVLTQERTIQKTPSVKYRGIFINDEMWGIRPWAFRTLAPEEGKGLGPTAYAKVFELLLRLKANCIWPAMHQQTRAFNLYPENKLVADKYGIVMGTSHCEPMLRNNIVGAEWDREHMGEDFNYVTNKQMVYDYWEKAVKSNGKYENIYTLGKRGKDDEPAKEVNYKILGDIIKDQRHILAEHVNKDVTKVPQMMIFYTEVLNMYNQGAEIPDDVIFCWPDDNFGNMRQLPNAKEQKRKGGSGVYYHFQWINGATSAYPWVYTSPLALTWYEMKKAYDYNAREFWIVNVGDIKPAEIAIDHFLSMAWDITKFEKNEPVKFVKEWATYNFGSQYAEDIAEVFQKHTELGYVRRPEHLVSYNGRANKISFNLFSPINYNDEAQRRIDEYDALQKKAEKIYDALPVHLKDAFFETVLYSVKGAALQNKKILYAQKSILCGEEKRGSAARYAAMAQNAEDSIFRLIDHYNTGMVTVGSKWNYMASLPGPWGSQWRQWDMPEMSTYSGVGIQKLNASLEGGKRDTLPGISVFNKDRRFIDLYNSGNGRVYWNVEKCADWVKFSKTEGMLWDEERIWVEVDWDKAPKGTNLEDLIVINWRSSNDEFIHYELQSPERQKQYLDGTISFTKDQDKIRIHLSAFNPEMKVPAKGFVESNGYISMEAENFSRKNNTSLASWNVLEGLGRSGNSVTVLPTTIPAVTAVKDIMKKSPSLEYDIYTFTSGKAALTLNCSPSIPINREYKLRYAYSIDNGEPVIAKSKSSRSVAANLLSLTDIINLPEAGQHTLKIWLVDPGLIIDKIILNTGGVVESYLGPQESAYY